MKMIMQKDQQLRRANYMICTKAESEILKYY